LPFHTVNCHWRGLAGCECQLEGPEEEAYRYFTSAALADIHRRQTDSYREVRLRLVSGGLCDGAYVLVAEHRHGKSLCADGLGIFCGVVPGADGIFSSVWAFFDFSLAWFGVVDMVL
jgi:hypothetical protein